MLKEESILGRSLNIQIVPYGYTSYMYTKALSPLSHVVQYKTKNIAAVQF